MRNSGKQHSGRLPTALLACAAVVLVNPILAQRKTVTVPAGTSLLVRMIDTVDSNKNAVGSRFSASLETNLEVDGVVVAPAGTKVYGRLAQSKEAGRMAGKSGPQCGLTQIVLNSTAYPVFSSDYQ